MFSSYEWKAATNLKTASAPAKAGPKTQTQDPEFTLETSKILLKPIKEK